MRVPRALRALTLLALAFGLSSVVWAAWEQDLTYDEPTHLQWSRRLLEERVSERRSDPMWNSKTPVMIPNVLAKKAGRAAGLSGGRALTFCARLPGFFWYAALLLAVFLLARRLAGPLAAHLAAIAAALDPNLVANAAVATVDAPYTLATLLALAAGLRYAEQPGLARAALVGLALGFAFATKFTAFLLIPGLALIPLVYRLLPRRAQDGGAVGFRRAPAALLADAAVVAAVAMAGLSAAYLFVDLAPRLGTLTWKSDLMARVAAALPGLRLPLPADFLTGFDICMAHERERAWSVLILGRSYADGVGFYFLVSWLLKTPLALLAAQTAGLGLLLRARRCGGPALVALLLNLGLHLFYFSFLFRAQIGYRYVLMGVPLLALLAAAGWAGRASARALTAGAWIVALGAAAEALPYLGNTLAFTNVLVQPKSEAYRYLTNSSIDWGQNDEKLRPWLEKQGWGAALVEPVHIRPGLNVIGLNVLAGAGQWRQHRWLREHARPGGHFRHTYLWFEISPAAYERFLYEDRRLPADPQDEALCAPELTRGPVELATLGSFPDSAEPSPAWVVCVTNGTTVDLGFSVDGGGPLLGRPSWLVRDWDRLRAGEQAWYRLEPGVHALAVTRLARYQGHFELRGGTATFRLRPARVRKAQPLELL